MRRARRAIVLYWVQGMIPVVLDARVTGLVRWRSWLAGGAGSSRRRGRRARRGRILLRRNIVRVLRRVRRGVVLRCAGSHASPLVFVVVLGVSYFLPPHPPLPLSLPPSCAPLLILHSQTEHSRYWKARSPHQSTTRRNGGPAGRPRRRASRGRRRSPRAKRRRGRRRFRPRSTAAKGAKGAPRSPGALFWRRAWGERAW